MGEFSRPGPICGTKYGFDTGTLSLTPSPIQGPTGGSPFQDALAAGSTGGQTIFSATAPSYPLISAVGAGGARTPLLAAAGFRSTLSPAEIKQEQLVAIFPHAQADYLHRVAEDLNRNLAKYGLDTVLRKSHFFAQVRQEGGAALHAQVESLNYDPKGLEKTFLYYRQHRNEAEADGRVTHPAVGKDAHKAAQETIANNVYANRNGNGSVASGDGWKFRGRGFIQLTGRDNYKAATDEYVKLYPGESVDFEKNPDLVAQFPYNLRCAVCFWIKHGLQKLADLGSSAADVDRITKIVNSATDSYADRRVNFTLAFRTFSIVGQGTARAANGRR